jgi:ABC-type lipoprotein release transport system permease subunit
VFSIKLGLKNLTRQKRRNLTTALIIAFVFLAYLFMDSLMKGMEEMSFQNIINFETGHIQITDSLYWEEREELPLDNLIYLNQDLEKSVETIDGLLGASPELRFSANLNNGIDETPVIGVGIIPEKYNEVFTTQKYLVAGSMFSPGESRAIIGKKLAELMDLKINDYITLLVRTKENTFNTIEVEIAGLVNTPYPIINNIILSALERTAEIGMMKALGMREWEIIFVFMVEATGIGIIGGLIGCLLGAVGVGWLVKYGYDVSYVGVDMAQYGIPLLNKIYGVWNYSAFVFILFFGIMVALFSSIAPALWAAGKDPVKAIYHR